MYHLQYMDIYISEPLENSNFTAFDPVDLRTKQTIREVAILWVAGAVDAALSKIYRKLDIIYTSLFIISEF